MRYRIHAGDDKTYRRLTDYLEANCPGALKVTVPGRHLLGADDLSRDAIAELRRIGAEVEPDLQWDDG